MGAYAYCAALHCAYCARTLAISLQNSGASDSGDSDSWPQYAGEDGGGEADSPQHCDTCGVFLANPLTAEGRAYLRELLAQGDAVRARLADADRAGQGAVQRAILDTHARYREFYGEVSA